MGACLQEGGEGSSAAKMATDAGELGVKTTDHIENKCAISDYLTQVT